MTLCRRSSFRPSANCTRKYRAVASDTRPYRRMYSPRSPPAQYSRTMYMRLPSCRGGLVLGERGEGPLRQGGRRLKGAALGAPSTSDAVALEQGLWIRRRYQFAAVVARACWAD
jgi:hypothetical protein